MSSGKSHDRINIYGGIILTILLKLWGMTWLNLASFIGGWLIATFIFSPDSDLMPKKRTKLLQFVLYPYAILFKHRGISHSFLFGTFTRVFYVIISGLFLTFVLNKMDYLQLTPGSFTQQFYQFIVGYDYNQVSYKVFTWCYVGMFGADALHLMLDWLSSLKTKILRLLK